MWRISNSKDGLLKFNIEKDVSQVINKGEGLSYIITKRDITLEPATKYTVNLVIGSDDSQNKPVLIVYSRKGKNTQHQLNDIVLSSKLQQIRSTFSTTDDIEEENQGVRINILGKQKEPIDIKTIEIWLE